MAVLYCVCVCVCVLGALCAIYNFYFLLFIPHFCETLQSLEGHLQICPMSVPLVEHSIFFGMCVTFAGCHILGMAPSGPPRGLAWRSSPEPQGGACGSFRALCQPPDNWQQWESSGRGRQSLSPTERWSPPHHCSIMAARGESREAESMQAGGEQESTGTKKEKPEEETRRNKR